MLCLTYSTYLYVSPNLGRAMRFFFSPPKVRTGSGAHCAWVPGLFAGQFSGQDLKLRSRCHLVPTSVRGSFVLRHISCSYIKCPCILCFWKLFLTFVIVAPAGCPKLAVNCDCILSFIVYSETVNRICPSKTDYNMIYTVCPTRYRTRHFFNNYNTNEDIATKFEQEYVRCVRNEK